MRHALAIALPLLLALLSVPALRTQSAVPSTAVPEASAASPQPVAAPQPSEKAMREADRFGLEITRDNHDCATAFVKLQQENLSNPRPGLLYKLWRSSHPPPGERIDFCNQYRPWEKGEPLRYEGLMRRPAT